MAFTLDIDLDGIRLNLLDVLGSLAMWADLVVSSSEESHRHILNLTNVDEWHLLFAIEPVGSELLEPVGFTVHHPMLL